MGSESPGGATNSSRRMMIRCDGAGPLGQKPAGPISPSPGGGRCADRKIGTAAVGGAGWLLGETATESPLGQRPARRLPSSAGLRLVSMCLYRNRTPCASAIPQIRRAMELRLRDRDRPFSSTSAETRLSVKMSALEPIVRLRRQQRRQAMRMTLASLTLICSSA